MKIRAIRLDQILVSNSNCRKDLEDLHLDELAKSIEKYGLLQPVVLIKRNKNSYELILGQRRFLAHQMLGYETIKAIIVEQIEDIDILILSLQENIQRVDLKPFDRGRAFEMLFELHDKNFSKVAEIAAVSETTVRNYLRILTIDISVQRRIKDNEIELPLKTLTVLSDLPENMHKIVVDHISDRSGKVQQEIVKDIKNDHSKFENLERKKLISGFILKILSYRFDIIQRTMDEFLHDINNIIHKFKEMKCDLPILKFFDRFYFKKDVTHKLERLKYLVKDVRRDKEIYLDEYHHFVSRPSELFTLVLEDFHKNFHKYNVNFKKELTDELFNMLSKGISEDKMFELLNLIRKDFKDIFLEKIMQFSTKIADKKFCINFRIKILNHLKDSIFKNKIDLIKQILLDRDESILLKKRILDILLAGYRNSVPLAELQHFLVELYYGNQDEEFMSLLIQLLKKIGKICSKPNCSTLINLDKKIIEIKFCHKCGSTYCNECRKDHYDLITCQDCGRSFCHNCHGHYEPLNNDILDQICVKCTSEGKYDNTQVICNECLRHFTECYVCGKIMYRNHREYKDEVIVCKECAENYEVEEEFEEEEEEDLEEEEGDVIYIKKFVINEFLMLKLGDNGSVDIFIADQLINTCKFLLIPIKTDNIAYYDGIESIDDVEDLLDFSMEGENSDDFDLEDEELFWGHCSNLQAWAEHDYDTRIIHRSLAFPLLKRLAEAGDPKAKRVFKEEISKRIESGHLNVIQFLLVGGYLNFLTEEELTLVFDNAQDKINAGILNAIRSGNNGTIKIAQMILKKMNEFKLKTDEEREDEN